MKAFHSSPEALALLHRLADAAGAAIRPYFRTALAVTDKDDASPVTLADRAAEDAIRALLRAARPEDGIWGEEGGKERADADYVWVIDPIDGTKSFVTGKPLFATLVALTYRGAPVLGLIDQPILGERWIGGAGCQATLNGAPARTRPCAGLAQAYMAATTPAMFPGALRAPYDRLASTVKHALYGGDAYNYALLASGHFNLVIEAQLQPYDFAALAPIVAAAGGVMTDWQGAPLTLASDGKVLAAGDAALHAAALALLAGAA